MMMDWLQLSGKTILVFGVANRKSVAFHIGRTLSECGAEVVYVVRSPERKESLTKLLGEAPVYVCDVEHEDQIARLRGEIAENHDVLHGMVHSIALAEY